MLSGISPREITKYAATVALSIATKRALIATLDSTTDVDTDAFPVDVATSVGGAVVAVKLMPVTDRVVDAGADRVVAAKNRRIAKKSTTES